MLKKKLAIVSLFFFNIHFASANDSIYFEEGEIQYRNHAYLENIHTTRMHLKGNPLSFPVIELGSPTVLHFSFDDLDDDIKNYGYRIIHCNFNWERSSLSDYEYLEGYYENSIRNYESSFNTSVPYTHYMLDLPNRDVSFTKSGNYLLLVYLEDDPENPVITRRFSIYESKTTVKIDAHAPTATIDRDYKQEIDFSVLTGSMEINDPFSRMHVAITQNGRWDNASMNMTPKFIKDREIIFDDNKKNVFDGITEYRKFNIQSFDYQTEDVDEIVMDSGLYTVRLLVDEKRTYKQYMSHDDLNGNYLVKLQGSNRSYIDADYVHVEFRLKWPSPILEGDVYIIGDLADSEINDRFKMTYDTESHEYRCTALIKQGYYNYMYGLVRDNSNFADVAFFEGMHFETENDYQVFVYYSDYDGYDRLIGYETLNTLEGAHR